MKIKEIVDADPLGLRRVTRPFLGGKAIGTFFIGGAKYLYWFEEGQETRMLSKAEITEFLTNTDDDWRFSNQ